MTAIFFVTACKELKIAQLNQFTGIHIPSRPVVPSDYNLVRTVKIISKAALRTSEGLLNHKIFSKIPI